MYINISVISLTRCYYYHIIVTVWSDIRTDLTVDQILAKLPDQDKDHLIPLCGLPVSTYWSALKIRWLIDHIAYVRKAIQEQRCLFGTVDSWIIWVIGDTIKIIYLNN